FVETRHGASLQETQITQPALFTIEYAIAQLWLSWDIVPQALIGHSIGEYVAATLAGVFSLEDALKLVAKRGQLMQQLPPGDMLAVRLPHGKLKPLLPESVTIAAHNSPSLSVISGTKEAISQIAQVFSEKGIEYRQLHTSHAFHSPMMEAIVQPFATLVSQISLNPPQIPLISTMTGTRMTDSEATNPAYWAKQLRQCVCFSEGIEELLENPNLILLEMGPGRSLSTLTKQHSLAESQRVFPSMRHPQDNRSDVAVLLETVGNLWLNGKAISWSKFWEDTDVTRIPLPTYPFEKQRYWIEAEPLTPVKSPALEKKPNVTDWFYSPTWKRTATPLFKTSEKQSTWLIFLDNCNVGNAIATGLQNNNSSVITVAKGDNFKQIDSSAYQINPSNSQDYAQLIESLADKENIAIAHCWGITDTASTSLELAQECGFFSLLYLVQALKKQRIANPISINLITNSLYEVTGNESLSPEKSTVLGLCKTIPQEIPNVTCRHIDIDSNLVLDKLANQLFAELTNPSQNKAIAYRGNYRWIQEFDAISTENTTLNLPLKQEGVYLITGGLGSIGLEIADYLASNFNANLVLISRSFNPPNIAKLKRIKDAANQVLILQANVANQAEMEEAIAQTKAKFGTIHGVIHAAGLINNQYFLPIAETDQYQLEQHFQAKVNGLLILEKVLKNIDLDFCLICSSLSTILGGLGYSAYAAANQFMDTFAYAKRQTSSIPWISVNWDGWQFNPTSQEKKAALSLLPSEGIEAFKHILTMSNLPQVIVSTGNLQQRIEQWINIASKPKVEAKVVQENIERKSSYIAPRNEIEEAIVMLYQDLLGVPYISIKDDFFALGGDSLLAVHLMAKIQQQFNQDLPLSTLLENATVEYLAKLLPKSPSKSSLSPLVAIQPSGTKLPFFCVHPEGGNVFRYQPLSQYLGTDQPFYGLQTQDPDISEDSFSLEAIATSYIKAIKTVQSESPYLIGGWSMGGIVAFEIAQQLKRQGEKVALLAIFDMWLPLRNSTFDS
ncbi:MAG: SDR family NAD(P)-dependent oxidoreductase, partial [Halothece sp.]